jgi:membrane-bound serine protease (ClpP class)
MDALLILGIGLLGLSVLLIMLEVFVPSGGILGIGSLLSAIAGIVFLFRYEMVWGASGFLMAAVLGPMIFIYSVKILPSTPIGRMMLGRSGEEIAREHEDAYRDQKNEREHLLGLVGEAATDMRPGGVVLIEGHRHDAVAVGGIIDLGCSVKVTKVSGLSIEVRAIDV